MPILTVWQGNEHNKQKLIRVLNTIRKKFD